MWRVSDSLQELSFAFVIELHRGVTLDGRAAKRLSILHHVKGLCTLQVVPFPFAVRRRSARERVRLKSREG